jgi:heme exporter protein C
MQAGPLDRAAARLRAPSGGVLLMLAVGWAFAVVQAPEDSVQGVIQKILYVHPACAFAAYLGFGITAIAGALYLWRGDEQYDRLGVSAAEVGVVFCTLALLTGPIWARGTWGRWWSWDPRLTVTLLLWFIYLAYLLLRGFTEGSARGARFAAIYGIAGIFAIPLNYFAIDLFGGRAIHPENLSRGSLGTGMGWPFALGVITALVAFAHLVFRRLEVEWLRARELRSEAGAPGSAAAERPWGT